MLRPVQSSEQSSESTGVQRSKKLSLSDKGREGFGDLSNCYPKTAIAADFQRKAILERASNSP